VRKEEEEEGEEEEEEEEEHASGARASLVAPIRVAGGALEAAPPSVA
jgi:hypothetical protein